jgi:oxygen-independent coproporphyrinogen-3 oxidase
MLGLRLAEGIDISAFTGRFGLPDSLVDPSVLARLEGLGFIEARGGRLRLTEAGLPVSDSVLVELAGSFAIPAGIHA